MNCFTSLSILLIISVSYLIAVDHIPAGECPDTPGKNGTYYRDLCDCNYYYECEPYGYASLMPCPAGLYFNEELKVSRKFLNNIKLRDSSDNYKLYRKKEYRGIVILIIS